MNLDKYTWKSQEAIMANRLKLKNGFVGLPSFEKRAVSSDCQSFHQMMVKGMLPPQ